MKAIQEHVEHAREVLSSRYADLHEVAEGHSGLVFSAHKGDPLGPAVALKVAFPALEGAPVPASVVRFRREVEIASTLHHPHIRRLAPIEVLDGVEFCEMEGVGPVRLDQVALGTKPPSFERVLALMQELADALDYAHAHGVVHGALSTSRVLLDPSGHVRVSGFMLYKDQDAPHSALAPSHVGNPAFMPPEQRHASRVDRRVDVYAAGIIAYELCSGHPRVMYESPGVAEIRPLELAPNRPLREGIPLYVTAAIRRATTREPSKRFATVGEFVQAMAHPEKAHPPSLPTTRPDHRRPHHFSWMPFVLVMLLAALAFVAIPSSPRHRVAEWTRSVLASMTPERVP